MTGDARQLAAQLRNTNDRELSELFRTRGAHTDGWRDLFDVAEALLEASSVRSALETLPVDAAAHLASAVRASTPVAEHQSLYAALALLDTSGRPFRAVADIVDAMPAVDLSPTRRADAVDSAAAAERAFTTVNAIAELLLLSFRNPLQQIATGALASAERRRLVEGDVVADPDDVDAVLRIAATAELVASVQREWLVTQAGAAWLSLTSLARWQQLRTAFVETLPQPLRAGTIDAARVYPWNPRWATQARNLHDDAFLLGLVQADGTPTTWAAGDEQDLLTHLPAEVDKVFLQNDLSAIAPGPLEPRSALRLRNMAERESGAQASMYRFTEASVQRAFSRGETEQSLLEFLADVSLTGIPQPLHYLVQSIEKHIGTLTVQFDAERNLTVISPATPALAQTLLVDQTLRPLGFVRSGDALTSRVTLETVANALAESRYPVTLLNASGQPEPLQRGKIAPATDDEVTEAEGDLIARLRGTGSGDEDAAWLRRELDVAVRQRATLEVTIALPDGARVLVLEAAGIGGGRLRGRDKAADVERTLPISAITAVTVLPS